MKMSLQEAREARKRRRAAQATLACEGIHLTDDELALFEGMEDARMCHEERRQHIAAYFWRTHRSAPDAAEWATGTFIPAPAF